jgi:hypothetical protein
MSQVERFGEKPLALLRAPLAHVVSASTFEPRKTMGLLINGVKSESGRQPTLALICSPQLLQRGGDAAGAAGDCGAGYF